MPRRYPKPLYKRGDILQSTKDPGRWFMTGFPEKYVVLEVKMFQNLYVLDCADPERRTQYSKHEEWFNDINNVQNYTLVVNPVTIWRVINGED